MRKVNVLSVLATVGMTALASAGSLVACGGSGNGGGGTTTPGEDAGADQSAPPDSGVPAPGDAAPDSTVGPGTDGGAQDAGNGDGGSSDGATADAADAISACGSLAITGVAPPQGWNGVDVTVTIRGSGFVPCGTDADGGDAGACADTFALVATACAADAGLADAGPSDGGGAADAGAPSCVVDADGGGTVTWPLTNLTVTSATTATATVSAGALAGKYALVDTQGACSASLADAYTVLPATVTVSSVTPAYGWTGTETALTIAGSGFVSTPRAYVRIPTMSPPLQRLPSTAFVTSASLTSVAPPGLDPGGPYDLLVVNPDNTGGVLPAAFRVVSKPTPSITSLSPSSLTTSALGVANNVTITGCNFRGAPTIATISGVGAPPVAQTAGTLACTGPATCPGGTNVCTLDATIGGIGTGAFLVTVTDPDQGTTGEYSALVVTNPSAKLSTGFVADTSSPLHTGRRALGLVSGRIDDASRFLYAIGGEDKNGVPLASVEVAPLDLFGGLGSWAVQRNTLGLARSGVAVAQLGKYVYAIGGESAAGCAPTCTGGVTPTGTPLSSVERAKILDDADVVTLAAPVAQTGGSLAAGAWYYRVSVVRDNTDPANPLGEGLPSDEAIAQLGQPGSVALSWSAPPDAAHIAKYRVYRTPSVNGASQTEVLLFQTPDASTTTFVDDGTLTPQAQTPLGRGATGVFVAASSLSAARLDASATIARDSTGQAYVYVTGGFGKCKVTDAFGPMSCYEYATISADGATLGSFTAGVTTFGAPRARHGASTLSATNGISGYPASDPSFVFVAGGVDDTGSATSTEYAAVTAGGQLGIFASPTGGFATRRDGTSLQIANGYLYAFFGGNPVSSTYTGTADLTLISSVTATTVTTPNWSSAAVPNAPPALGRMGVTLESAYFYVVGGTTNDADALDTVYQVVY